MQMKAALYNLFVVALFTATAWAQMEMPPALVRSADAVMTEIAPFIWVPGTVVSKNDARVSAEVNGRLVEVLDIGTRVAAGDTLARIDDTSLKLELAEAEAELVREKARLRFADQELKRIRELAEKELVTTNRLDQARSARDTAKAELVASEARWNRINDQLDKTAISAPFAGIIVERVRQKGERVEGGDPVVRLVDPESVEVQARVTPGSLPHLTTGAELQIRQGNSNDSIGSIRSIVPVGDDLSRLYDVRIEAGSSKWPAGTTVRVAVPTEAPRKVVAVPRDALVLRREGVSLFKIGSDGTAVKVAVETGIAAGELIEVIGDVSEGDQVVIRGGERLQPGQSVNIESP